MTSRDNEVREVLTQLADGRSLTTEELAPLVYEDLRRLADSLFRKEQPGITLQPTALVNEAYMVLADQRNQTWENRAHFMGVAATAMRRLLTNAAVARRREKRGGGWERVTMSGQEALSSGPQGLGSLSSGSSGSSLEEVDLLELDEVLQRLAKFNERYVRIIELRYFAGMGLNEVASILGVSRTIVVREWAKARAWLATALEDLSEG